jgi:hypothetical protein
MFGSVGSIWVWKPSPPPTLIQFHMWMPPLRVELGPHQEPLSCRPVHTQYGRRMSTETWYGSAAACRRTDSQVAPPSQLTSRPPSLPYITCWLLSGSIQIAWLSTWPMFWSPLNVLPPSVDFAGFTPPT